MNSILENPKGKVVEVNLTEFYVKTLQEIYSIYKSSETDAKKAEAIFDTLSYFDFFAAEFNGKENQ